MFFMTDVTRILSSIEQGDAHAAEQLLPLVYDELRKLAAQKMAQEKPGQTLDATALVHDAYLRLVASGDASAPREQRWNSRGPCFAAATEARCAASRAPPRGRSGPAPGPGCATPSAADVFFRQPRAPTSHCRVKPKWRTIAVPVDPERVQAIFLAAAEQEDAAARAAVVE